MGRLYKRNNVWFIDYHKLNGQRVRESTGTSNKIIAQKMLTDQEVAKIEGRHDIKRNKKIFLSEMATDYLERYSKINKKSSKRDEISLKHLVPFLNDYYLYQIDSLLIEDYKAKRITSGAKPATVNRELALLKHIFTKAIEWGKVTENPVKKVKLFKENNRRLRYLEKGEIHVLLEYASGFIKPIIITAIHTGMRQDEILSLVWDRVNLDKGLIEIINTKNNTPRFIPINSTLWDTLEELKRHCNLDSPFIFCDNKGLKIDKFVVIHAFRKALKQAGIKDCRFHDLRHTFASQLVMAGADILTVKELLGHKTLEMTLRYSHLSPDYKKSTVELLSNNLAQKRHKSVKCEIKREPQIS
jgi:integrase